MALTTLYRKARQRSYYKAFRITLINTLSNTYWDKTKSHKHSFHSPSLLQ